MDIWLPPEPCYKHTQYIKMINESFDTNVPTSRDNHMTQHDSKQCVSLKVYGFHSEGPSSTLFTPKAWQGEWATKVQ